MQEPMGNGYWNMTTQTVLLRNVDECMEKHVLVQSKAREGVSKTTGIIIKYEIFSSISFGSG